VLKQHTDFHTMTRKMQFENIANLYANPIHQRCTCLISLKILLLIRKPIFINLYQCFPIFSGLQHPVGKNKICWTQWRTHSNFIRWIQGGNYCMMM